MKKNWILAFCAIVLFSCSDNEIKNSNPFLPGYSFAIDVNMALPLYSPLLYPSGGVVYPGAGIKGIIIFNTGNGYNAFDAACPNQIPSSCIAMTIKGIDAVCSCEEITYSLFTGLGSKQYPLKQYRVEQTGNSLRIYN